MKHSTKRSWLQLNSVCVVVLATLFWTMSLSNSYGQKSSDSKTPAEKDKADKDKAEKDKLEKTEKPEQANRSRVIDDSKAPAKTDRQLAEERKAREAARKRGEITFDDLKFDIEKGGEFKEEMITKPIKELDKTVVKLRGFILPTSVFKQAGIDQFVLVRDNQECCFGPGAALYDCVIVQMQPGKTTNFTTRVVAVKGKMEIDTESFQYPDGGHYAVYKITAEEVK